MFLFRIRPFKWQRNAEDVLTFYLLSKSIMSSIIVNSIKKIQRRSWKWVLVVSNKKCINVHPLYSDWPTLTEFLLMINIDHQEMEGIWSLSESAWIRLSGCREEGELLAPQETRESYCLVWSSDHKHSITLWSSSVGPGRLVDVKGR